MLAFLFAQGQLPRPATPILQEDFITNRPSNSPTSLAGQEYQIGRDDLIEVNVFEIPELAATTRVTASGTISLPYLFDNGKTELNLPIFAGDVINVLRAGSVFVEGEVMRPNVPLPRESA